MVKTLKGTCAIPLTEEFVSASGVDADEFYGFLQNDKSYSHFQKKKRGLDLLQDPKGDVKPVPFCSLERSKKVLLSLFDDGPVRVALEPTTIAIISVLAYYGVCSFMQAGIDDERFDIQASNFASFVGRVTWTIACIPATVVVNIPLRVIIKGDMNKNTPYN